MKTPLYLLTLICTWLVAVGCSDTDSTTNDVADALTVTPTTATIGNTGGIVVLNVKSNRVPSVSSSAAWITLDSRANNENDYVLNMKASANTEPDQRIATLTVSCGSASQTVTITQSAMDALTVTPTTLNIDDQEQYFVLRVETNGQPDQSIDAGWLQQVQAEEEGTRRYHVDANNSAARSATITFRLGSLTTTVKVTQAQAILSGRVDASVRYQTIEGFSASDCWAPAVIGRHWTNSRDGIAELLFSRELKDGQPTGIGLSMWRTNLGAGSWEQGLASNIGVDNGQDGYNYYRRAESYLNDDLTYDWSRCQGQRFFLDKAKEYGLESIVLFSNSPNVQFTRNGKAYSDNGNHANLKGDCYDDFAQYMARVAAQYRAWGYPVTYISPVNEPQYKWDGHDQEGSGWYNSEVAKLTHELDAALTAEGLDDVRIVLAEAASWRESYSVVNGMRDNSDCIRDYFDPASADYVGDLVHVAKVFGGHSYWTDGTWSGMRDVRQRAAERAQAYNIGLWQTEWSMLGDGYSEFPGYDNSNEMDIALVMDKVIHNDLTVGNMSSWSFWTSMDVSRWSQLDRFMLIDFTPAGGTYSTYLESEGTYKADATLWVLGNYSLFIRPGYQRIALDIPAESRTFFGSAYISPDQSRLVVVVSNLAASAIQCRLSLKDLQPKAVTAYTTTLKKHLQAKSLVPTVNEFDLDASSVTTLVFDL